MTAGRLASRAHRYRPEVHAFGRAFDILAGRASGTPFRGGDEHARLATTARTLIGAMGAGDEQDDGNG